MVRICSPDSINKNMDVPIIPPIVTESPPVSNSQKELEKFRNFWSFYETFEDDEIEIKEELNTFDIEDLVVEEVTKYRERNTWYIVKKVS